MDGHVDLDRIATEIGETDIICIQEIEQYFAETGDVDQVAALATMFPQHHWVFAAGVDLDADTVGQDGRVHHRRRRFGNMLLSASPIRSMRAHLLPKHHLLEQFSMQRVALDAVIATPSGPVRVITTHLAHASTHERLDQIDALLAIVATDDGGSWSGRAIPEHWSGVGDRQPPAVRTLLCGDLNLTPDSIEYERIAGDIDIAHGRLATSRHLVDAWIATDSGAIDEPTCTEDQRGNRRRRDVRLDYLFATPDIAGAITRMWTDHDARGSDHRPIFADIDV